MRKEKIIKKFNIRLVVALITLIIITNLGAWGYMYYENNTRLSNLSTSISYAEGLPAVKLPYDMVRIPTQSNSFKIAYSTNDYVDSGDKYLDGYVVFMSNTSKEADSVDGSNTLADALNRALIYTGVIDNLQDTSSTHIYEFDLHDLVKKGLSLTINEEKKGFTQVSGTIKFTNVGGPSYRNLFKQYENVSYNYFGYTTKDNSNTVFVIALDLSKNQKYFNRIKNVMPKVIKTYDLYAD